MIQLKKNRPGRTEDRLVHVGLKSRPNRASENGCECTVTKSENVRCVRGCEKRLWFLSSVNDSEQIRSDLLQ